MNRRGASRTILFAFFITLAMITWRNIKQQSQAPPPSEFTGAAIVFSLCALFAEVIPGLGATLAVGWTLGIAGNIINYKAPVGSFTTTGASAGAVAGGAFGVGAGKKKPLPGPSTQGQKNREPLLEKE